MKPKYTIIILLLLMGIAASTALYISNSEKNNEYEATEITLTHDKGWLPTYQENFTEQGKKALEEIGIGIHAIPSDTTDLFIHQMKASLPTEQAPDLFTWWSTYRVKDLVDRNLVGDLTDIWEKYRDEYPKGIQKAFDIDGRMYGFPYGVDYWPVWYNKRIFRRLKLKEPDNWQAFIQICDAIKAAGIPPILSSVQYKWPSIIWFEEMIIGENPDLYEDLCLGKAQYTDPPVKKALGIWREMIKRGYFTEPSANMLSDGGYLWKKEAHAMVLCGTWYYDNVLRAQGVDADEIGAFILPSHNPKAGKNIVFEVGPVFTAQNGKNTEAAKKVAEWWMGKEGNGHFARLHMTYPGNLKVDTSYLPVVKEKLVSAIKKEKYRVLNRYWEATPVDICSVAVDLLDEFMLNPDTLDSMAVNIQKSADQYWSKRKRSQDTASAVLPGT